MLAITRKRRNLNSCRPAWSPTSWRNPIVGVGPGVRTPADAALSQRRQMRSRRRRDRCHSLMRHRCLAVTLPVGLLPSAMGSLSRLACLIPSSRGPDLDAALRVPARLGAVTLAAVATCANREHRAAAWLATLTQPKSLDMIVHSPHLITIHRCRDDSSMAFEIFPSDTTFLTGCMMTGAPSAGAMIT